jgi:hypothetical protein
MSAKSVCNLEIMQNQTSTFAGNQPAQTNKANIANPVSAGRPVSSTAVGCQPTPLQTKPQQAPKPILQVPFYGKPITGTCRMVSTTRFVADIGYQQQLVATFKTINGALYGKLQCSHFIFGIKGDDDALMRCGFIII